MKNITTALVCFLFSVYSFGQCDYSLKMLDSYGDGWNNNTIDVLVDGVVVLDDVTMADGAEEIVTFSVTTGAEVTTIWNGGGAFASEVSYEILDNDGNTAATGNSSANVESGQCIGVCPVIECIYSLNMLDSWGDGWNGNSIDVLVDGIVVLDNVTLLNGTQGTEIFTVAEGSDITTVWNGGGSWATEVSYEILDTDGSVTGTGNSTTDILSGTITAVCPSCSAPADLQASANSYTEATLSWLGNDNAVGYEIIVQLAGTGAPTASGISLADTTYLATNLTADTTYEFYVLTDCGNGSLSNWAGPFEFYMGYCDSVPSSIDNDALVEVVLASTTFTSTGPNPYEDFTTPTVDVSQAIESQLLITLGAGYTYDVNVWIDFNNDLVFDNDTELVFSGATSNANPVTIDASFTVPVGTPNGVYNMRIGGADFGQATPDPCYNGSWGVTADMTINVTDPPDCIPPSDLDATPTSFTEATLSWVGNESAIGYEIVIQAPGTGEPTGAGIPLTTTSYNATGLTQNTSYEFYVISDCGDGSQSPWAGPFEFYMGYCDSVPSSNDGQGITEITLVSSTFISAGDVTYEDFTSPTVDVMQGVNAEISISFATGYTYDTNIWIDFNGDLVFDSDTELVYDGMSTAANPTTLDASFLIPEDTPLGTYNMRIGTADFGQSTPDPCYNGSWGVTVDMTLNVIEAPSCFPPSGLSADNITGTSADLSWTGHETNITWEYVLQLNGEAPPTGSGTSVSTPNFSATGLDYSTTYDLYVMANCSEENGNSIWVGPYSFTTSIQTVYDVDCDASVPLNINYCYENNEDITFTFTSSNLYPFEIVFNSGNIEGISDDITIYDGPDNSSAVLFNNNASETNVNDLTGLVVESTSPTVFIEIISDGSLSCQSSSFYNPIDFDVICKTCITQTVDFAIVGSCEPNQEFFVEVNLSNLGDALSVDLTDNQGSPMQTVSTEGVYSFGPYPSNEQVNINTVNSDDESCSVESGIVTFLCPPPPNECSIVYAGEDTTFCSENNPGTTLSADYHIFGQDTNSYDVTSQENCPTPPSEGGTPIGLNIDDRWSNVIDLGFEFCFFGETYSQILIGSNGVLSFDLSNANGYNAWSLGAGDTVPNSSNITLSDGNIFGVAHDIDPSVCGSQNYMLLGSAPSRQFVVNYVDVCHFGFSCNDNTSTTQIILYESSNVIDINIIDKPLCLDWNGGLAAVGVQNSAGTVGFSPPERNTGTWETSDESWRFSPSVGEANYVFEWYDGDTLVGTEDSITVYPEETTIYTAAVTYNLCNGDTATVTDDVLVEITPTPIPVAVESEIFICDSDTEAVLEVSVDPAQQVPDAVVYYWTYNNIDIVSGVSEADGGTSLTLNIGSDLDLILGDYTITALNTVTGCFSDTIITVNEGFTPVLEDGTSFNKCANGDVELSVNITNDTEMSYSYLYSWYIGGELMQEDASGIFVHGEELSNGPVEVIVTETVSMCSDQTTIMVDYFMNQNCVDMPQGISPNGDGFNDCLVLDHLEAQEDIIKAEIYNRYGVKVFELNDYIDHWCGQDASDGNDESNGLLPVGTYFYVIQYASDREPTISWIYLNY